MNKKAAGELMNQRLNLKPTHERDIMSIQEGSQDPLAKLEEDTDARFERSEKMLNDRIDELERQLKMAYNTLDRRIQRLEYP